MDGMSEKSSSLGACKDAEEETEGLSCGNKDTDMDGLLSTSIEPNECGQESVDLLGHTAVQEGSLKSGQGSKSSEESSKVGCVSQALQHPAIVDWWLGLLENLHQLRPWSYFLSYLNASSSYPSSKLFNHSTSMHPPAPVNSSADTKYNMSLKKTNCQFTPRPQTWQSYPNEFYDALLHLPKPLYTGTHEFTCSAYQSN